MPHSAAMAYGLRPVARYIVSHNMLISSSDGEHHIIPDTRSARTATRSMASQHGRITLAGSRFSVLMVTRMNTGNEALFGIYGTASGDDRIVSR